MYLRETTSLNRLTLKQLILSKNVKKQLSEKERYKYV